MLALPQGTTAAKTARLESLACGPSVIAQRFADQQTGGRTLPVIAARPGAPPCHALTQLRTSKRLAALADASNTRSATRTLAGQ